MASSTAWAGSDPSVLILTSLSGGPKHGYAMMTDVAAFSGVSMEPGTLYGALSRLERRGWVRPLATEERRRPYESPGRPGGAGRAAQQHAAGRPCRPRAHRHRVRHLMTSPLAARLSRFLVRCYPPRWRQRYAEELLEVLDQRPPTARTVLGLWAGAVSAHLDPAWRAGRHPAIRLRRWARMGARVFAGIAAVLLVFALGISFLAWRGEQGDPGPPMPLSDGVFGMAFSPDGRTVAVINPSLELWDVADRPSEAAGPLRG